MINTSEKNLLGNRWGILVSALIIAACFWLGYRWVVQNNQPDSLGAERNSVTAEHGAPPSPTENMETPPLPGTIPQKIPKEYNPGDTLLDLKIDRDREKSRDIETIKELLAKVGLTDKVRQEAEQELWRLTAAAAKEHELEGLLKAKGFRDCFVNIGQQSVTVVVGEKIDTGEARSIGELMAESTSLRLDQIRIVKRMRPANEAQSN